MMRRTLLACLLLVAKPLIGFTAMQLRVRVLDTEQGAVKGARVYVTDAHHREIFAGETNIAGEITGSLAPGRYEIDCQRDGFQEQTATVIMADADKSITIVLALARQTTAITVSERSPHLDTATEAHQDEIQLGPNQLDNLPVRDGDVLSALAFFTNPAGGQSPTIIVDGMERTDSLSLTSSQIQEVRINSNAYSAEFPQPGKDRIEIDTKVGGDALHGGLFFRTRNSIFDARNPLAPANPPYSRYGYGFDLGRPIVRKRLFFFLSAEREEQQQVAPILAFLPSGVLQQDALTPFTSNLLMGKLDWQMTASNRLSAKYEWHEDTANEAGVGGFVLPEAGATQFHHDNRIEISDQYIVSSNLLNNFQMALGTNYLQTQSATNTPSIIAAGAFAEGGAQLDDWSREPRYEFLDTLSRVKGPTTIKFGVDAKFHPFSSFNADNFGGTYQYASLSAYEAAQPLLFTLNAGNPLVVSEQDDYAWFLQTERQFRRLTLFAGVRHEFQSHLDRYSNLAPRLEVAWALDQDRKTILRVGAGVFYDRRPPIILQQVDRFNGINELQYVIENPPLPVVNPAQLVPPQMTTVYQIDPTMTLPRTFQASATLERQLGGGFVATADYTFERGNHLLRTRNINAPMPVTLVRPDPERGNVDQIESSASSLGNILNITLKSRANKRYQLFAQYTLSSLFDDTDDEFGPPPPGGAPPGTGVGNNLFALPVNNYDLRPEWGPANNDIRHRFGVAATVQLPRKFSLGTLTSIHSGLPYNITTGEDNNQDTDPNDRPPGVTRNTGRGGGYFSIDLHFGRTFGFEHRGRSFQCEVAADSFNVLNHFNPSSYVGVITSPLFGQPNAAYNGRQMQFSLNVHF